MLLMQVDEATAALRRIPLHLVDATDGITPETGENGEQPEISKNGGAFASTTATLTALSEGAYYVELTAGELDTIGLNMLRFKSANTAEFQIAFQVVAFDPYDAVRMGMTSLPNAVPAGADGLPTVDASNEIVGIQDGGIGPATLEADTITAAKIADDAIAAEHIAAGAIVAATFGAGAINAAAIASNAITAAKIAADAITEAKIADDAIAAEHIAAAAIVAATFGAGAIDAAAIAADAITAAKIATDAIAADGLATSAVDEIVDGVWTEDVVDHKASAGSFAKMLFWVSQRLIGNRVVTKATGSESVKDTDEATELYVIVTTDDNGTVTQNPGATF